MDRYTEATYFSSLISSGYIWLFLTALLLLAFIIIFNVKTCKKYAGKAFSGKDLSILIIGYILSAVMMVFALFLAANYMNKDRIAIKKEMIAERYNLNFVEDVYGMMPPKEGEKRSTRSYEPFNKVEPRLYKGTASLYSNADKKFYKFSYVFDDEGIFLQENVEAENKSPDDFLKDKTTVNNK